METDLFMYETLVWLLDKMFDLPMTWMVPYTVAQIRKETDFLNEAKNGELAKQLCEESLRKYVSIPTIYHDVSTKRILVCEFIDGVKITQKEKLKELKIDSRKAMELVTRFFSHQMFVTGHLHADPHPGNVLIRKTAKNELNIVVIDHGLYCDMTPAFRKDYANLWVAMLEMNQPELMRIATAWGIRDHELFASFQLFKPYKPSSAGAGVVAPITSSGAVTKRDMLEFQLSVKTRVRKMLQDTSLTPPELSLVGRSLNLVRSLNKGLETPVNRPKIMADYAMAGSSFAENNLTKRSTYNLSILFLEVTFYAWEAYRKLERLIFGRDVDGLEAIMDREMEKQVQQQLGIKVQLSEKNLSSTVDFG